MKISQHNLFDLIDKGTKVYHSALLTTFSFDPVFFERYYMPQLRRRGIRNVILLVDAGRYDAVMQSEESFAFTKKDYAIVRVEPEFGGVFHPKVSYFVGKNKVMAIVGSGNLTYSGIAYNDELWGAFCIEDERSPQTPLLRDIWEFLKNVITNANIGETVRCQLDWIKAFSDTIQKYESIDQASNYHEYWFLYNEHKQNIYEKLSCLITGDVKELCIISPFYDQNAKLVKELKGQFKPIKTLCAIQPEGGLLPHEADFGKSVKFYKWCDVKGYGPDSVESKRMHAKAIQFKTSNGTFLLIGSTNATVAAFGLSQERVNTEAGVLVYDDKGKDFLKYLGLSFTHPTDENLKTLSKSSVVLPNIERPKYKYHLKSCEIKFSHEMILSSDKPFEGQFVRLFFDGGHKDLPITKNRVNLSEDTRGARMAVIIESDIEISNRCIIWHLSDLETRNPDRTLDEINALFMDPEQGWDSNISKVLSYVELDISKPTSRSTKDFSTSDTAVVRSTEAALTKEQFDDISLRQSMTVEQTLSMKILDYIQFYSSDNKINADEGEEAIDTNAMTDGDDVIDTSKAAAKKSLTSKNDITSYLKRLIKHYDNLAGNFDKSSEQHIFMSQDNDVRHSISCNCMSHILIAIILTYHRILHPKEGEDISGIINKYIVKIIGRFSLIFRNRETAESEYTKQKIRDMHNNLVAYALLVISMSKINNSDKTSTLLVLNLLDLYAEKPDELQSALKNYHKLLDTHRPNCIKASVDIVKAAIKLYKENSNNLPISTIGRYSENMLIYRSKFGFMFAKQVFDIKPAGTSSICTLPIIYPGFKNNQETIVHLPSKVKVLVVK
jgi:hypothetical protein